MNNNLDRQRQKSIDRMRKKMINNRGERNVCLVITVGDEKNDPNEILNSLKPVINSISLIYVTLSEKKNESIDIICNWCKNNNFPIKINFNRNNRDQSVKISKLEFPDTDYFLLSNQDETWVVNNFDKTNLIDNRYDVLQNHGESYYPVTRLLSAKINWVCKLGAFEYWINGDNKNEHPKNIKSSLLTSLKITSISEDDYEHNVKLLLDDLNNPTLSENDKLTAKFYLAKIFKDNDRFNDAIYYSTQRINGGGWEEEIYYSIYNIGMVYEKWGWKIKDCFDNNDDEFVKKWNTKNLNQIELMRESVSFFTQAIIHYKKAYEFRPSRSESLYSLAKLCRMIGTDEMNIVSYQTASIGSKIQIPNDKLYVNTECYDYLFAFEKAMISYLIPDKKQEGVIIISNLLNREDVPEKIKNKVRTKINNYI